MQNGSKSKCTSTSHHLLMENAKNRVNDLQERFAHLQAARIEGRTSDVVVLEEQVYQSLREWKAELNVPSSASSLLVGSLGSFSDDIGRLLQLCEEEDDATSEFLESSALKAEPKPELEHDAQNLDMHSFEAFQEEHVLNANSQEHGFQGFDQFQSSVPGLENTVINNSDMVSQLDYHQFGLHQVSDNGLPIDASSAEMFGKDIESNVLAYISPPPSAFMGPKCALWDCARPAQGSQWYHEYCSSFHASLSLNEGSPGMAPILRPGGIVLKDNLLFDALSAKTLGKSVGIPHCEGAATTKSPWNASDLFDLFLLEGETIREWLFFDKPRRAFDSGNRKQRSLPDHIGRGWHESRKQVMKEFGGQKRSYYMDPQPSGCFEWHLFEYEINGCDAFALYRLEVKLSSAKKSPKGKVSKDSLADLQKKMGRLTAEFSSDNKPSVKDRTEASTEANADASSVHSAQIL
ncbi:transcription factor VOZ1-like [Tripterygium wilfordii]|uniref:Transcription factor VOZ1-like n=1 Tax=Tripterygium wilfordii TaxID=458696 RepID=A0A7J7CEM1_TRIWF|nr:transcription factor VOZ1-like [Tripterygium wilfordii]